ncbi:complement component C7 [Bombina bombina]|uniref:complement component C7 n=1 Tax=Bombina bombina TaxID=8345 RepID=UPI00235A783C|nr:complement component C7 [Bombina bombina]
MRALWVTVLPLLEILQIVPVFSSYPVNCRWGSFGPWSECDGCSKTQTRRRTVDVYAQFGGLPCFGSAFETQSCVPTRGCPIEDGCGDRFRCFSGQCISKYLVCNGDHDCEEDSADEAHCEERNEVCNIDKYPPNTEFTGLGYDIIKDELKKNVIHTKSFGGKCRKVFSGDKKDFYRLSDNVLTYTFKVAAKNDFSYDFYNSSWSYKRNTEMRVTSNYGERANNPTSYEENKKTNYQLMVIENSIEVAQFINNNPEFLTLAEPFWKELANLPSVYEYSAYRKFIDNYGTHFLQSGSLGGHYKVIFYLDSQKMSQNGYSLTDMEKCTSSSSGFLFFKKTKVECRKLFELIKYSSGSTATELRGSVAVIGGDPKFVAGLSFFNVDNPAGNEQRYASWAGSVTKLPSIIKRQLTPLYELVKEVPCSSVKKYFLKQAIEEYMNEISPCKCRPCQNKGQPAVEGTQCVCYCRPYTFGPACEFGFLAQDQPGVIDGIWSCWSSWTACVRGSGRRTRTRTCNNPSPSGGGKYCIGELTESQQCEDGELEHFRTVEPHCFDTSIAPTKFCSNPPPLANGFVKDAGTSYPVGKHIVYTCADGFTLIGEPVAKCEEDLQWHTESMECQRVMCLHPNLPGEIRHFPEKDLYDVGDKISLHCSSGFDLEGPNTVLCSSSLDWYPNVKNIQCKAKISSATPKPPGPKCQPWEDIQESKCSCKMPSQCGSSVEVCASDVIRKKNIPLTVCKMHALECMGRTYSLTKKENCNFPTKERSCDSCHLWETCKDQTNTCVCREAKTCKDEGISICVQVNGNALKQTMTECEAGILLCQGVNVAILSINPCDV